MLCFVTLKSFQWIPLYLNIHHVLIVFFVDGAWEYTLPDLHGNALKLLNALIKAGVVKMPKYRYKQFLDCYFKDPLHVKKKTLSILKNAISSIKVAKK